MSQDAIRPRPKPERIEYMTQEIPVLYVLKMPPEKWTNWTERIAQDWNAPVSQVRANVFPQNPKHYPAFATNKMALASWTMDIAKEGSSVKPLKSNPATVSNCLSSAGLDVKELKLIERKKAVAEAVTTTEIVR